MAAVSIASDIEAWQLYHVVHSMLKGRGCWEPSHSTLEREKARKYKSPRLRPRSPESTIVARCNKKCFLFIYHFYFAAKNQAAAAAQVSVLIGAQFRSAALNRSARTSSSSATSPSLEVRVHRRHQHQQHQHQHYPPQRHHLLQQQHEEADT